MFQCWLNAGCNMWEAHNPLTVTFPNVYQFLYSCFTLDTQWYPILPECTSSLKDSLPHSVTELAVEKLFSMVISVFRLFFFSIMIIHPPFWLLNVLLISLRKWRVPGAFPCIHMSFSKLSTLLVLHNCPAFSHGRNLCVPIEKQTLISIII